MRHIAGDALEHSRIRLERDLDDHIPSPMFLDSRVPDDEDVSSVDFPRHNSRHPASQSFEHASHFDSDFYSRYGEDDSIALDPELGYTMSTAAHHASALTLSAGLRGRGAYNPVSGRASPSGAEYDPDRPLQTILDNRVADGMSLFDATSRSKSQGQTNTVPSFDPVVVDSTAELDRFLRTGQNHRRNLIYSQPSSSDTSDSDASHPRLTHALGTNFSPKRPRSAPAPATNPSSRSTKLRTGSSRDNPSVHYPKPAKTTAEPQLYRDKCEESAPTPRPPPRGVSRPPFSGLVNKTARLYLPDVTGLTSAVQSPAKNDVSYAHVKAPATRTLNLIPALDTLQKRLQELERANGVSRRRVRELEHELEGCRAEVLAERTWIEEHGREAAHAKAKHRRAAAESRYRTVVAEKKALEALLTSLRSHLTRLTEELSTHKTIIESLRTRADHNARAAIQELRLEVERLAVEVERLKAIAEEGLRERRRTKQDQSDDKNIDDGSENEEPPASIGIDLTYLTVPPPATGLGNEKSTASNLLSEREQKEKELKNILEYENTRYTHEHQSRENHQRHDSSEDHREEAQDGQVAPVPITNSTQHHIDASEARENTRYTQHPEYHGYESHQGHERYPDDGSQEVNDEQAAPAPIIKPSQRYIDASELARIEAEVSERRFERSRTSVGQRTRGLRDEEPVPSVRLPGHTRTFRSREMNDKENKDPTHISSTPRPAVRPAPLPRTPFPQIRGSRMERLFFSAPEHNVRTCTACHRRKRQPVAPRETNRSGGDGETDGDKEAVRVYLQKRAQGRKDAAGRDDGDGNRPPPQTVLARVVRELEDDFSHYKSIYLELAEQYGIIDAASNVAKRNVLADHLRDVIDTLEQKGDQIASLYDLLHFEDKALPRLGQDQQEDVAFA